MRLRKIPADAITRITCRHYVDCLKNQATISISASGNGESREAQSDHEPQQHYDNLAAHGQGLRCLHCKYNNNVHTRKEKWQKSDGWGRKSYDAACCPPLGSSGSGRQVRGGRSGKGYNPYSSKKPRCTNCNGKVLSDVASVMVRVRPRRPPTAPPHRTWRRCQRHLS